MRRITRFTDPRERRRGSRASCHSPVRIRPESIAISAGFTMMATEVGPRGVFLASELLFQEGERMDLEYRIPGQLQPVKGVGQVVRVETRNSVSGPGMAVRLIGSE